jgi:hypothetical protein
MSRVYLRRIRKRSKGGGPAPRIFRRRNVTRTGRLSIRPTSEAVASPLSRQRRQTLRPSERAIPPELPAAHGPIQDPAAQPGVPGCASRRSRKDTPTSLVCRSRPSQTADRDVGRFGKLVERTPRAACQDRETTDGRVGHFEGLAERTRRKARGCRTRHVRHTVEHTRLRHAPCPLPCYSRPRPCAPSSVSSQPPDARRGSLSTAAARRSCP